MAKVSLLRVAVHGAPRLQQRLIIKGQLRQVPCQSVTSNTSSLPGPRDSLAEKGSAVRSLSWWLRSTCHMCTLSLSSLPHTDLQTYTPHFLPLSPRVVAVLLSKNVQNVSFEVRQLHTPVLLVGAPPPGFSFLLGGLTSRLRPCLFGGKWGAASLSVGGDWDLSPRRSESSHLPIPHWPLAQWPHLIWKGTSWMLLASCGKDQKITRPWSFAQGYEFLDWLAGS